MSKKTFGLSFYKGEYSLHVPPATRERKRYDITRRQALHLSKRPNCKMIICLDPAAFSEKEAA